MSRAFETHEGLVLPIDRANIDTDAIIPKQFMKSIERSGFGDNLFDEWRYQDRGEPGQDCSLRPRREAFALNQPRYQGASILLTQGNFGCGSSREHAPWALYDYGIRVLIAPGFADIFHGNCFKNGMLPVVLPQARIDQMLAEVAWQPGYRLRVDLHWQTLTLPSGEVLRFEVDPVRRERLLQGLDDIALTLQAEADIRAYEDQHRQRQPWLFGPALATGPLGF
jgi:3-isopropylmalate/(R)-2-methylmalate dehydratase small subunit